MVLKFLKYSSVVEFFRKTFKNKNPMEVFVGFFVLFITIYFLSWGLRVSRNVSNVSGYRLVTNFSNAGGIIRGADVSVNGVKVGEVVETSLNSVNYSVDIILSIDSRYKIPVDTIAAISSYGIIGKKYIKLEIGNNSEFVKNGGKLKSRIFKSLEEIIGDLIFKDNK